MGEASSLSSAPSASVNPSASSITMPHTRGYQQEMLDDSLHRNIIIALDTGSGKTLIAVLRMKHEAEREPTKLSWFFAPTVALCEQQKTVIQTYLPVSVGLISGALEPNQWKDAKLWERVLRTHRIMVSTPQVFLDALRHGYVVMGRDISLLVFDEAHHAVDNHPYNRIMQEFYFDLPTRDRSHFGSATFERPMILGLTASPIYGGNVEKAFQTIERNLDCTIRAPRRHRAELAKFVHRPVFKHVMYQPPNAFDPPFSTNYASLCAVLETINIEDDPYVQDLRRKLSRTTRGSPEYHRVDQKLSKVIVKQDSFTHRGLRDFARAAGDICLDLGPWAADWYVWKVLQKARRAANPYNNIMSTWKDSEKVYLLGILNQIVVSPVSYYANDITEDSSDKLRVLVECLLAEKAEAESHNESYSGLIFVQRRDSVLALKELLSSHPLVKDAFRVGILLGTSESAYRHSFLDITRHLADETQEETIAGFRIGEKNLIVSTSVAEEGIDIQACGSVIRWDPPPNMASWVQSRGRARRQRSTFTLLFADGTAEREDVAKWENVERQMVALYNDAQRDLRTVEDDYEEEEEDDEDDDLEFRVESTGALLTLHSAVSHLSHFCAVIPSRVHVDNRPLYDVDPPEFPEGWHTFDARTPRTVYTGPYGSKVTLPRCLPVPKREFQAETIYKTKISAHRHAAFFAYKALYDAGLLNESLLPITSITQPQLEDEVKAMLADVEKRFGTAKVSLQMNPWEAENNSKYWWSSELSIDGLPPLWLFTRSTPAEIPAQEAPFLYRRSHQPRKFTVRTVEVIHDLDERLTQAREYTRRLFWSLNGSRMEWENTDFSYLFLPFDTTGDLPWVHRRAWLAALNKFNNRPEEDGIEANAELFGKAFHYPSDLNIINNGFKFAKAFQFVCWRFEQLSPEEELDVKAYYEKRFPDLEITYPLLVVQAFPPRTNFLFPLAPRDGPPLEHREIYLIPGYSSVTLLSFSDVEYAILLPSIIRSLSMSITVDTLRRNLFPVSSPLQSMSHSLLKMAMTAPNTSERMNYQRLETLGDTVLKFISGLQLLAEYPLWHEGYLTKGKDHAVSNVRLAKENIARRLYSWIIRDRMVGKKWKPSYASSPIISSEPVMEEDSVSKDTKKKKQDLSTKVLADVVESLIGAAYLQGGFPLGYECAKFFDLGLRWDTLPARVSQVISLVPVDPDNVPSQLKNVEEMLGYSFTHKMLLIEALTHASYQDDMISPSYERLEFLGDSVLDMVVTDYLYRAPGKEYSPGHIHLRRSAIVNGHTLSYICLRMSMKLDAVMPKPNADGRIAVEADDQEMFLWKCLLHSSPRVLEDQFNTFARYRRRHAEIEEMLESGAVFPWAALTRLQAPKFFSDMVESLIGAVYLDSGGSIDAARGVMQRLGITQIMERIVQDDVDVLHPVSRMSLWAQKREKELEYVFVREKGAVSCVVLVDGVEEARVTDVYRGKASQEEVKYAAAEKAIKAFHLRDVDVNYSLMKKKTKPRKTKVEKDKGKQKEVSKN